MYLTVVYTSVMKTIINIKADKKIKEQAQQVARDLGLPLSTVINAYLMQFIRNKEVHLSAAPRMTHELESIISTAQNDLKINKRMSPLFSSGGEMDRYLDSV